MSLRPKSAPTAPPAERKKRLEQVLWAGLNISETLSTAMKTNGEVVITLSEWEWYNPTEVRGKDGEKYYEIKGYPGYRFFLIREVPNYAGGASRKVVVRAEPPRPISSPAIDPTPRSPSALEQRARAREEAARIAEAERKRAEEAAKELARLEQMCATRQREARATIMEAQKAASDAMRTIRQLQSRVRGTTPQSLPPKSDFDHVASDVNVAVDALALVDKKIADAKQTFDQLPANVQRMRYTAVQDSLASDKQRAKADVDAVVTQSKDLASLVGLFKQQQAQVVISKAAAKRRARRRLDVAITLAEDAAAKGAELVVLPERDTQVASKNQSTVLLRPAAEDTWKGARALLTHYKDKDLGHGNNQAVPGSYRGMKPVRVYDVDYSIAFGRKDAYMGMRSMMRDSMDMSEACGDPVARRVCVRTDQAFRPETNAIEPPLDPRVNEKLLIHGTSPEVTELILKGGFSDQLGTREAYGPGVYQAEDPTKSDQYVTMATGTTLNRSMGLRKNQSVAYLILSRVVLGCTAHTNGGSRDSKSQRDLDGKPVYNAERGSMRYGTDSLLVEFGAEKAGVRDNRVVGSSARHREFIVRQGGQCLPAILVVYERDAQLTAQPDYKSLDCKPDSTLRGARVIVRSHNVWYKNEDFDAVADELTDVGSYDFLAVQEGTKTMWTLLRTALRFVPTRTLLNNTTCGGTTAWAGLVYNSYRFRLIGDPFFGCFQRADGKNDSNRPAAAAVFVDEFSRRVLVVASIHAPHFRDGAFSLQDNLARFYKEALKQAGASVTKAHHYIVAGDFNEPEWYDNTRHGFKGGTIDLPGLKASLSSCQGHGGKSTLHRTHKGEGPIDNILHGAMIPEARTKLASFERDPDKHGSDHWAVSATLRLE